MPDPVKVRHTLDGIAEGTHYLNLYSHIHYNTRNKLVIRQLQNEKLNFPNFCKTYARQNQKTNLIYLYIHLVETFAVILRLKIVF